MTVPPWLLPAAWLPGKLVVSVMIYVLLSGVMGSGAETLMTNPLPGFIATVAADASLMGLWTWLTREQRPGAYADRLTQPMWLAIWGVLFVIPVAAGGTVLLMALDMPMPETMEAIADQLQQEVGSPLWWSLVLVTVVGAGLWEEFVYRRWMWRELSVRFAPVGVWLLTSLVFAAAHVEPVHVLGTMGLGMWFGILRWRLGTWWPGVLAHALNNGLAIVTVMAGSEAETAVPWWALPVLLLGIPLFLLRTRDAA